MLAENEVAPEIHEGMIFLNLAYVSIIIIHTSKSEHWGRGCRHIELSNYFEPSIIIISVLLFDTILHLAKPRSQLSPL